MRSNYLVVTLASAAVAAVSPGIAQASETGQPLGQHVSECAQTSLGQRANPPAITCSHDGQVHVFATFGEMVHHMKHHAGH